MTPAAEEAAIHCQNVERTATRPQCNAMQCNAMQCNVARHVSTPCEVHLLNMPLHLPACGRCKAKLGKQPMMQTA